MAELKRAGLVQRVDICKSTAGVRSLVSEIKYFEEPEEAIEFVITFNKKQSDGSTASLIGPIVAVMR